MDRFSLIRVRFLCMSCLSVCVYMYDTYMHVHVHVLILGHWLSLSLSLSLSLLSHIDGGQRSSYFAFPSETDPRYSLRPWPMELSIRKDQSGDSTENGQETTSLCRCVYVYVYDLICVCVFVCVHVHVHVCVSVCTYASCVFVDVGGACE